MPHPRATAAGNVFRDHALRVGRHLVMHFSADIEPEVCRFAGVRVVVDNAEGPAAVLWRKTARLSPVNELADRVIDPFRRAAMLHDGDTGGFKIDDLDLHGLFPFRDTEAIAVMPGFPVRLPPECGGRLAEGVPEGARKRFRVFEAGVQGDVDDFVLATESEPITGLPQTQQLDVTTNAGTDVFGKLPMEVKLGEIGDLAQKFRAQRFAQVGLDMVEHFREAPCVFFSLCVAHL